MALLTVGSCKKESRNNAVTWSSNPHLAMSSGTNSSQPTKEEPPSRPEANSHYLIYFRTVGKCVIRVEYGYGQGYLARDLTVYVTE
ncbi:MAG: hypothetical protein SOR84_05025 [Candidatus Cryptobacteroides sp.]|nr:hypothetical protein [Candidatus Cryptobacteroides sp.]